MAARSKARKRAVDRRHPVERPLLGVGRQQLVDARLVRHDALDELGGVLAHRRIGLGQALPQDVERVRTALIGLVEHVQRPLAGLAAGSH